MSQIAYLLLSHKAPGAVAAQARGLVAGGDRVVIHYDRNAPRAEYKLLRRDLADLPGVAFARRRHACGWGEWSLVAATLETLATALGRFPEATHFYMISGDCAPIKTAEYARNVLDRDAADYIESHDFFESDWIKTGLKGERLHYRHWVNERKQKWLFYTSLAWQRRLGLRRGIPAGLRVHIGSQWWCLRRSTAEAVLAYTEAHPEVLRFFSTTWIPDETFFQTLVRHLVPAEEIHNRTLTFLLFTDYGLPATFYSDQYDMLLAQDALFARKISPEASVLKGRLWALYGERGRAFAVSGNGERLYRFLAQQGRQGRRFAPRFWEAEASLPRDKVLLIALCKKWHVAKRLAGRIRTAGLLPAVDYAFDEAGCPLPDLGGIDRAFGKRHRHRRMLVHLLLRHFGQDRLLICLDPSRLDMVMDFANAPAETRVLEIDCKMDDAYLAGHATRIGLVGQGAPDPLVAGVLPPVRANLRRESEALKGAGLPLLERVVEGAPADENALSLARFLGIPRAEAAALLGGDDLFRD